MMWRYFIFSILACFLWACGQKKEPQFKIGVSQCSEDTWRDKMNEEMQREMLFHENAMLEIRSAHDDNDTQIADIRYFLDNDFDIIIVAPNEAEAVTPAVKEAFGSGTPVIIFDRRITGDTYTAYIDLDNTGIGYAAAEYAHSVLGPSPARILEITGLTGSSPAQERHRGFVDHLKDYPSIELVASVPAQWEKNDAYKAMDSLLNQYPDLKLVYAQNDFMALGVDSLLRERGRRDIMVLGTDATAAQGIQAIKDGKIDATFIYPTDGHRIIRTAMAILQGDPYDSVVHVPALTSVDSRNADILLRQNDLLKDETEKVLLLNEIHTSLTQKHTSLSRLLHAVVTLAIVLGVMLVITLIIFFRNRRLQKELKVQNKFLEDLLLEKSSSPAKKAKTHPMVDEDNEEILPSEHELHEQESLEKDLEEHGHNGNELQDHDADMPEDEEKVLARNEFYQEFLNIIRTEFSNPELNTETMAQHMRLGPAQFTRKIKALTGFTPVEILRNYRLERARKLLLTSSKSINEITYAVGFTSPAYLTKCFREHFGTTPSDLRGKN